MSKYKERNCRLCDSKLNTILNLGDIAVSDFVSDDSCQLAPLDFCNCEKCGLIQLRHDVERDTMYRKYYYQSGLNPLMVKELNDVANRLKSYLNLKEGDSILDIGANDGTFLQNFKGYYRVGIDPAKNIADKAKENCDLFINDYFPSSELKDIKFKGISSIAMFYDLPDPKSFVSNIKKVLTDDGVWVIQFTDLLSTFKLNAVDNICHEHLEYYSLNILIYLFGLYDLEIFAVDKSDANGASIRTFVSHKGKFKVESSVISYLNEENEYFKDKDMVFKRFIDNIDDNKKKLKDFIKDGGTGFILSCSTKLNTLLQYWNITDKDIKYGLEINKDKFGKKTVVTNIPIIEQEEGMKMKPDYLLVGAWHFLEFFKKKFKTYLENDGKLIVPLPEFRIYTKKDL